MKLDITCHNGGCLIWADGRMVGMILEPSANYSKWRFVSEHGDMSEFPTLLQAEIHARQFVTADYL